MINLLNGRGQLGSYLSKLDLNSHDVDIYHTWNFIDKSEDVQKNEFEKLLRYLEKSDKKVVFISTSSTSPTPYLKYKRAAEEKVMQKCDRNLIIRLPCIIGKGIFSKLKNKEVKPFGVIEFVSMKEACDFILKSLDLSSIITCKGWKCSAETLQEILRHEFL
jgi:hypothetical protein